MYCWRSMLILPLAIASIYCILSVSFPIFTPKSRHNASAKLSQNLNENQRLYSIKTTTTTQSSDSNDGQQRKLSERQPVDHCVQIWEKSSSAFPETYLKNICDKETQFLDSTQRRKTSTSSPSYVSSWPLPSSGSDRYILKSTFTNQDADIPKRILQQKSGLLTKDSICFKKWMTLLHRRIGNVRLGDLMIPGTHNSGSFSVFSNGILVEKIWPSRLALFLGFHDYYSRWARNHDASILAQLNAGYRCFDLRVTVLSNGGFYWWHGISGEAIDASLNDIAAFSRESPGEIIILLISHLNAPGNNGLTKLPMPQQSKLRFGRRLLSILGPTLVQTYNISLNPTISSVLATGRNVIAVIREDEDLVKAFPRYFWDGTNNGTTVEFFERKTNPRTMFLHRSRIMQKYKENFSDRLTITPAIVTHGARNILGGMLRSSRVPWIFSVIFLLIFTAAVRIWQPYRSFNAIYFFWTESSIFCIKRRSAKNHVTFIRVGFVSVTVISLSVSLAHLQQKTILHYFGFEGKANNLLEMARRANLCGDDSSRPSRDVAYRGINSMIRHWSEREQEYKLNIILVDDFSSSQVVQTAIQDNIRRTDRKLVEQQFLQIKKKYRLNNKNNNKTGIRYTRKNRR